MTVAKSPPRLNPQLPELGATVDPIGQNIEAILDFYLREEKSLGGFGWTTDLDHRVE